LSPDKVLIGLGIAEEAALLLLLAWRLAFKKQPAFFAWILWSLGTDLATTLIGQSNIAFQISEAQIALDSLFIFAVLVETTWSVLRPLHSLLPRRSWLIIVGIITIVGAILWPFARLTLPANLNHDGALFFQMQQTFAFLRVIYFVLLAASSQPLAMNWRNRELQIASGMGIYSLVSLAVNVLHLHQTVGPTYHLLDLVAVTSYLGSLAYWVLAFAEKEQERQDFSPQIANVLLFLGGVTQRDRQALNQLLAARTNRDRTT